MSSPTAAPGTVLDHDRLRRWRAGWTRVMSGFVPGLAILEDAIFRAAETRAGSAPTRVLDLGGGPGVLAEKMARRWPGAEVTMMDIDPVLLSLARDAVPGLVRTLDGDLSSPAWMDPAGRDFDLITVVMTMHYLSPARARALYAEARGLLAPGGLLVVADVMPDDGIASVMGVPDSGEQQAAAQLAWSRWWSDLHEAAPMRPLLGERADLFRKSPPVEFTAPVSWHVAAARAAAFTEAGTLWRCGRHAALAAIA